MVVNINSKLYRFECLNCNWHEDFLIKKFSYSLFNNNAKVPKKCPKCGRKLTRRKILIKY